MRGVHAVAISTAGLAGVAVLAALGRAGRREGSHQRVQHEQHLAQQERRRDERALRDAKLARLRDHYQVLLQAGALAVDLLLAALREEMGQAVTRPPGQGIEMVGRTLVDVQRQWATLAPEIGEAARSAALETGSDKVRHAFGEMELIVKVYLALTPDRFPLAEGRWLDDLCKLHEWHAKLAIAAREHLATLERPL